MHIRRFSIAFVVLAQKCPKMFNSCAQHRGPEKSWSGLRMRPSSMNSCTPLTSCPKDCSQSFGARFHQTLHSCADSSARANMFSEESVMRAQSFGKMFEARAKNTSLVVQVFAPSFRKCLIVEHTISMGVEFLRKVSENVQFVRTKYSSRDIRVSKMFNCCC